MGRKHKTPELSERGNLEMGKTVQLPPNPSAAEGKQMTFNGFSFPVLISLNYQADGPDKKNPDRLFIEDRAGRFLFYFEAGTRKPEQMWDSLTDYETIEIHHRNKIMLLRYPLQKARPDVCVGYFRIQFAGECQPGPCCYGDLSIRRPKPYFEGLREYDDLYTLFAGLKTCGQKDGDKRKHTKN